MTLKTKITLAFLTMLLLLLGVSAYTLYSLRRLDRSSRNVLKDNLYSVELGHRMLRALDQLQAAPPAGLPQFREALTREAGNITEPGERELVDSLSAALAAYERRPDAAGLRTLRGQTYRVVALNTAALTRKNEAANQLATQQSRYVLATLTFVVLVSLMIVLSVPEAAVSGLRKLSNSIDNAARQDFSASVPVESHDEFGAVARSFNQMLVQLQDYRRSTLAQLLAERNRVTSIVNNLDEGLLVLDETRRVLLANPVAAQLLAVPAAQLPGRPADDLARENDLFRELLRHLDVPAARRAQEPAVLSIAQAGEEVYYRLTVNDVVSFNEALDKMEFVGSVLTLHNVSEFKRLDQAKSNFLATVSHELKTPLSSINFSLKLLENGKVGPVNDEQQRILGTIKQENQRLLRLVGELLDVARLESGNIQLNFQSAAVAGIVQFAADTIQLQLQPKQLQLVLDVPAGLPAVRADVEKTTWVLLNLLSNAVRYSPAQGQLRIQAARAADGQFVRLAVRDDGPGIAPQYQERIFQRFAQVPHQAGYTGGSGLGLSIAREFIASQGGQIGVESELGSGSTFWFTLPVAG